MTILTLDTPVADVGGIGSVRAKRLEKLGIYTLRDVLRHFPARYEDRSVIVPAAMAGDGEMLCLRGRLIGEPGFRWLDARRNMLTLKLIDDFGDGFSVAFFNQPFLRERFYSGREYTFYGKVKREGPYVDMASPSFEETGFIAPVYPLTAGVKQFTLYRLAREALALALAEDSDVLPTYIREKFGLLDAPTAYQNIHFPASWESCAEARKRFVFEEFFTFLLAAKYNRRSRETASAFVIPANAEGYDEFFASLPFAPTAAQTRVIAEADADLTSGKVMNRLIQGDVGSGKTLVSIALIGRVCSEGYQAAFMAPTEILAKQHFETFSKLLPNVRAVLLTGSQSDKRVSKQQLKSGQARLAIGTHALLTDNVEFLRLALVITDEQHRFGVGQRDKLRGKSEFVPHVCVMSATPIPRTLALTLYGDLDVSIVDELPPGRTPVETYLVSEKLRGRIDNLLRKTVDEGGQACVVCPAIEDAAAYKSVVSYAEALGKRLPGYVIGVMHGKLKPAEKTDIMRSFSEGDIQILVSTTVIEVGIDVPNASLMVIENAERFGLSQLHQLRGRVGRGSRKSYCVLIMGGGDEATAERLRVFADTIDGFTIAEADLKLRGPGEFFRSEGIQHGRLPFRLADIDDDMETLKAVSEEINNTEHFTPNEELTQRIEAILYN
ncbi:MAG: ATP-dependent DNA helicase RecG [Oscillospiraceae bacterium]|jgi:ATP-dependent DNA helicase RecG|nr:ATP-dependent DNA helicase RecG [Oscillospiraceae bacterium]